MTTGQVVLMLLRITVPLPILHRRLAGGVIAMLLDALDLVPVEFA
jgi:hypothetical protein